MAKLKLKTKRAAAKRFKVTGTGKLVRNKAYKSHILTKKTTLIFSKMLLWFCPKKN